MANTCTVEDCDSARYGHGMCSKHYQKAKRRGELPGSKPCQIEDCTKPVKARGWCDKHLARWAANGDPMDAGAGERFANIEDAFAARTTWVSGGCLEFTGSDNGDDYGTMTHAQVRVYAHRYAWERVNGPIPDDVLIDHTCHNHRCCNVAHLRLASNKQNLEHRAGPQRNNRSSGVRGVTFHKQTGKWSTQVAHNGRAIYCGLYTTIAEAEAAVIAKRNELFTHNNRDR